MLSGNGIDHPLRNIGRMVSDTLKIFCNHQHIRCLLPIFYILIDLFDELLFELVEQIMAQVIARVATPEQQAIPENNHPTRETAMAEKSCSFFWKRI